MKSGSLTRSPLLMVTRMQAVLASLSDRLQKERGDIPGWVLVTVMTAGLVVAVWSVADGQLKTVLTNALRGVSQP
ncbi:MAG: hypothetical protein NWS06_03050 [Candidatus Nanopelagicales bacterium]|jgi:hypothetical protein|nr:hypothetical protein [Candidatus Nanopelagicales bacterium]